MSTNPYTSPTPLSDPAGYEMPGQKKPPVAGVVMGILHILYGLSMVICNGSAGLVFFVNLPAEMTEGNAAVELMQGNVVFKIFNIAGVILSMLSAFLFIAAGVALLNLWPFGRRLSIGLALFEFALLLISLVVSGIFLFPVLLRQIDAAPSGSPEQIGAIIGLASGLLGTVISAIYPSLVLFIMYRPSMIAAYKPADATAAK